MTGTPEQFIRICALNEARLADQRRTARRADRMSALRDLSLAAMQVVLAVALIGLVVL